MQRGDQDMQSANSRAMTVSELNEYTRRLLAGDPLLRNLEVSGEISGYKHHYSGHRYFTLKDADARVQCVMFRQDAAGLNFEPSDGMKVTLRASASVFVRDGSYQLYVTAMQKSGLGDLYARFEQLKAKLTAEGLFDAARKREIPMFPRKIGIVTSETGAAIRDMIRVARRRDPLVEILVAPCAVQGASAASEIVRAIRRLNVNGECDVLLVGRGGGSIEDLWAFNEEAVARAIAASKIPVISCVGHEIDFTIADFVADLRAPTPSAAAELAVPVRQELVAALDDMKTRLANALLSGQRVRRAELDRLVKSIILSVPDKVILAPRKDALNAAAHRLNQAINRKLETSENRLKMADAMLRTLNPNQIVERGYAIVSKGGRIVTDARSLAFGDEFELHMSNGRVYARTMFTEVEGNGEKEADL